MTFEDKVAVPILKPTPENVQLAAEAILAGELIAMPTETVYGIAADATNPKAIAKLFEIKGRPAENPLIVHISDFVQLEDIVAEWSASADVLANRFWPGPLTMVVKKSEMIPDIVTGGLDTVAVRMPDHPVALEVIETAGVPIAAPSANRFMQLSPTSAENIDPAIATKLSFILDGGPCRIGLESTVVDITQNPPRILRPGGISRGDIQAALGIQLGEVPANGERRSPGMYARHYAPYGEVVLCSELEDDDFGLVLAEPKNENQLQMPSDPISYGARLYDYLHKLDAMGVKVIKIQLPPDTADWEAVMDRLRKASA
ncbi:MAG: L-threonylcarbamoyladenylate synthase [Fimbriimonadaceae bacterium]